MAEKSIKAEVAAQLRDEDALTVPEIMALCGCADTRRVYDAWQRACIDLCIEHKAEMQTVTRLNDLGHQIVFKGYKKA